MERALELDTWNANCPLWGITTTKNNNATRRAQQQQGRTRPLGRLYEVATRRARSWCHRRTAPPEPSLGRHRALMHLKVHARPDKKSTLRCDSKKIKIMTSWPKWPFRGSTRASRPQQTGDTRRKYLRTASLGPRVCWVGGTTLLWTPDRPALLSNQRGPQGKKSMDHSMKKSIHEVTRRRTYRRIEI